MTWVTKKFVFWDCLESKRKRLMLGVFRIIPTESNGSTEVQLFRDIGIGTSVLGVFSSNESAKLYADDYYRRCARDLLKWLHGTRKMV